MAWREDDVNTTDRSCVRIAAALRVLAEEESLAALTGDLGALQDTQRRAKPLLDFIAMYAGSCREVHTALAAVYNLRRESDTVLAVKMASAREALRELNLARGRLSRVAPAYNRGSPSGSRLSALG